MSPQSLRILLQPLLAGDLPAWQGLPAVSVADFDALYGPPTVRREEPLGALPAMRHDYAAGDDGTLAMWSRGGQAVMLAPVHLPSPAVLDTLPAPDAVLAHEILVPGHYAHEYLYCTRGLVLTVAQSLQGNERHIARCRGMAPLAAPREFGPDFYLAFEDRVSWARLEDS
ncbi:MAG: hypothetical protein LCH71_03735 [Proteobacteria bacterium]|nr:hypothetical protein [Pseudomonadota bacterium]